jgi:hypothetical protein
VPGSVCLGVKRPSGTQDQIFVTATHLRVCWCGASFLTIGRVCCLQLLLALASAVIFRSKSSRTHSDIYWLRSEPPPTRRANSPYLYPPGTGSPNYTPGGPQRKYLLPQLSRCVTSVAAVTSCHVTFTGPLPCNGSLWLHNSGFEPSCHNTYISWRKSHGSQIRMVLRQAVKFVFGRSPIQILAQLLTKLLRGFLLFIQDTDSGHDCFLSSLFQFIMREFGATDIVQVLIASRKLVSRYLTFLQNVTAKPTA